MVGNSHGSGEVIVSITIRGRPAWSGEVEAMRFLIVIEKAKRGFSAYSPDLPGCVAAGATRRSVEKTMREAIELHLEGLREEGDRVPAPRSYSAYVDVPA